MENIIFEKYIMNGIEHELNPIRASIFPHLSTSQISIMNENTKFRGIVPNYQFNIDKEDISEFENNNKQYIVNWINGMETIILYP